MKHAPSSGAGAALRGFLVLSEVVDGQNAGLDNAGKTTLLNRLSKVPFSAPVRWNSKECLRLDPATVHTPSS